MHPSISGASSALLFQSWMFVCLSKKSFPEIRELLDPFENAAIFIWELSCGIWLWTLNSEFQNFWPIEIAKIIGLLFFTGNN